jgi:aminoglycoside phosphotransferase family enzyme
MSRGGIPDFISSLARGGGPLGPEVDLVQTHISYVLVGEKRVLKVKKPVDFGFLDFTTLEKRDFFCHEEVRLNRRLCPDIYLDVVAVGVEDGRANLEGRGGIVDYGVLMRRMPEEGMMPRLIRAGRVDENTVDALVDRLVPFYEAAAGDGEIRGFGRAAAVAVNVIENFDQTREMVGAAGLGRDRFDRIEKWSRDFLADEARFEERIAAGRIREGHGDLYSANICIQDLKNIHIFDCIEFNRRFRCCDVASDIAFLAMDLDFHGLSGLSSRLVRVFAARSGDRGIGEMIPFYKVYRAYVRGKIGLFTANADEVDGPTRKAALEAAARYFDLAESYLA